MLSDLIRMRTTHKASLSSGYCIEIIKARMELGLRFDYRAIKGEVAPSAVLF